MSHMLSPSSGRPCSRARVYRIWAQPMDKHLAFIRPPEGNGCAERFIRTLKENPLWIRLSIRSKTYGACS